MTWRQIPSNKGQLACLRIYKPANPSGCLEWYTCTTCADSLAGSFGASREIWRDRQSSLGAHARRYEYRGELLLVVVD